MLRKKEGVPKNQHKYAKKRVTRGYTEIKPTQNQDWEKTGKRQAKKDHDFYNMMICCVPMTISTILIPNMYYYEDYLNYADINSIYVILLLTLLTKYHNFA